MQQQNVLSNAAATQQGNVHRVIPETRKIIRRHIQNMDDVITDEDLRSIQILNEAPDSNEASSTRP